jgi:hypothetical protein
MGLKQTVLVVGDYNRKDFVEVFSSSIGEVDFLFLDYYSPQDVKTDWYKQYGKAIFWKDFTDAYNLLNKIKPDKVLFYFIESYNHAALNVACKQLKIPTYHLEHGLRDYTLETYFQKYSNPTTAVGNKGGKFNSLKNLFKIKAVFNALKSRLFFIATVLRTKGEGKEFLNLFFNTRKQNSIYETFRKIKSHYRVADTYISFSPANFETHQVEDHLPPDHDVKFIGLPMFDKWPSLKPTPPFEKALIFINQPLKAQGLLGWDEEFENVFIEELTTFCSKNDIKIYIKNHPYDHNSPWEKLIKENKVIALNEVELENAITRVRVVVGFFSTLLMPAAALPHTVLFTLENHPDKGIFSSEFLVSCGVSKAISNISDLEEAFKNLDFYAEEQARNKQNFIDRWMYKFDGLSGMRLKDILIGGKNN